MARDLNMGIEIVPCQIVREADGLALSSRNRYLKSEDRNRALLLSKALHQFAQAVQRGERSTQVLEALMRDVLLGDTQASVDKLDYAAVVDPNNLEPVDALTDSAVALIAAWVGETRLLDNHEIELVKPAQ